MLIFQLLLQKYEICFQKAIVKYITFKTAALYLKVIYKGFFKSFIVLYADRICPEHHFVEK